MWFLTFFVLFIVFRCLRIRSQRIGQREFAKYAEFYDSFKRAEQWKAEKEFEDSLRLQELPKYFVKSDLDALDIREMPKTYQEFKRQYRSIMVAVHPDLGGSEGKAKRINLARERLEKYYVDGKLKEACYV